MFVSFCTYELKKINCAASLPQDPRVPHCPLFLQDKYIIRRSGSCKHRSSSGKELQNLPFCNKAEHLTALSNGLSQHEATLYYIYLYIILTFVWFCNRWRVVYKLFCISFSTSTRSWIPDFNDFNIIITATSTWATLFLHFFPLGFFFPRKVTLYTALFLKNSTAREHFLTDM